jgi:hypothetical protein
MRELIIRPPMAQVWLSSSATITGLINSEEEKVRDLILRYQE